MTFIKKKILKKRKIKLLSSYFYFILFTLITSYVIRETTSTDPMRYGFVPLFVESISIYFLYLIVFSLTARLLGSLFLVSTTYVLFMLVNIEKINILGTPLFPVDFYHASQLLLASEAFAVYIPTIIIIFITLVVFIYYFVNSKKNPYVDKYRYRISISALIIVSLISLNSNYIAKTFVKIGLHKGKAHPWAISEKSGFLFSFIYRVLKSRKPIKPDNYNNLTIKQIYNKYNSNTGVKNNTKLPNIIIFFIEAFSDPLKAGLDTSYDPIPNFRKLTIQHSSGSVFSPVIGGKSANSEFELLTGFSMRFVNKGSIPYIDSLNHPSPSIAWDLKNYGYESNAIHVADLNFFNYKTVYPNLGFDNVETILNKSWIVKDPANRFPNEESLVNKIISITDKEKSQFVFAFPNSTHGFWGYKEYLGSDLNVKGHFIENGLNEIKTYVNAIHSADKAIKKMIDYYKSFPEDTIILILGDHQPSLPEYRQQFIIKKHLGNQSPDNLFITRKEMKKTFRKLLANTDSETILLNHRVPYVLWTNFETKITNNNISMNFLFSKIFNIIKINTSPLYNLIKIMEDEIGELSTIIKIDEFNYSTNVPEKYESLINDYKLLQYDVLYGSNYYSKLSNIIE